MPIKSEFTNWRDEQESWRTTAALMDLSTLDDVGSDATLPPIGATAQGLGDEEAFVTVSYDGYYGDCSVCWRRLVRLVGRLRR